MRIAAIVLIMTGLITACSSSGIVLHSRDVSAPATYSRKPDAAGLSDAERYRDAYEMGWWNCVASFADDIDFHPSALDRLGSGWPSEVAGFGDGYVAADSRIKSIRSQYGPERTQALLVQASSKRAREE